MDVNFIYEVEAEGHWYGSYRTATREEPEEYPEFEVIDTWSDIVRIELSDGETTIDITDRFPSKEQAEKDGNGKWYEEYSYFIKDMGEYAEEDAAERLNEDPPEDTRYEDYWDDREDWDESSMCRVNENSLPSELRDKALAAMRVLKNNAALSDSELKDFIKRARMMHRDELAQAAEDLLEYRTAAQGVTGDRETGGFAGIVSDFDESSECEDEDDGWNNYYLEDAGLSYVLDAINDLDYEIKNCVRGGNTGCKTYEELGDYIISLGEQLSEAGENVKYIR